MRFRDTARFRGRNGAAGGSGPAPTPINYGYQADRDEGTDGDMFVSTSGSDGNPGTIGSPKRNISAAMAAISAGQKIRVRAGKYRETIDFTGKAGPSLGSKTRVARYGNEQVVITAAETLTGLTACVSGDATIVGANWAQIYKTTINKSSIASGNPRAAHLYENGVRLLPCMARLPNPQYPDNEAATVDWLTSTLTVTSGGLITGYRLAALTDLYTQSQIENADVVFHAAPNTNKRTKVLSFDTGTKTINLTDQTQTYESNAYKDRFALINLLPVMRRGEWGFVDNGTTVDVYVWPFNSANVSTDIEYSARGRCVQFGTVANVEIQGLILERAASAGAVADGLYAINAGGVTRRAGVSIDNCLVRETYRSAKDYAPIWIGLVDNWSIKQSTISGAYGQYGVFCQGSDWDGAGMASGGRMDRCIVERAENSPVRMYGQTLGGVSRTVGRNCGVAAHSNKGNNYASCHRFFWHAVDFAGCSGYQTWQEASSIALIMCNFPVNYLGADGRGIVDQNSNTAGQQSPATEQGINGDSYVLNCQTAPFRDAAANTNSITLGKSSETAVLYAGKNNILHGASTVDETKLITNGWRNNLLTSGSPLASSAATDTTATPSAVYEDFMRGDIRIKSDSPSRSAGSASIAAEIAVLKGWFPDYDGFDYDLAGKPYVAATPPVGPYVNPDDMLSVAPIWIERPAVLGTPVVGDTLTLTDGYLVANPWPTRSYQWVRSTDLVTWVDISGSTASSYVVQSADIGSYVGCRVSAGTAVSMTYNAAVTGAAYPLATPTLVASVKQPSATDSAKNMETPAFTVSGKPLIVVASQRSASAADTTMTITVGTAGRTFGTGTALTFKGRSRRTSNESQIWFIANPGSGSVTVQMQSSLSTRGVQVAVFEAEGCTDLTTLATGGGTNLTAVSPVPSVTTVNANSGVLHIINRFNGDLSGNPISLTGVDSVISNDNTGSTNASNDLAIAIGYERAATAGAYPAASSWPVAATYTWASIEMRS